MAPPRRHVDGYHRDKETITTPKEDHFELQLIATVQKNQVLFDREHPYYKDTSGRQKLWSKLAKQLNFNGSGYDLEKKWRRMRDRYVRLKKVDPSNCHLREGEKWNAYFKRMRFLDPYIEHRQGKNQEQRYSHNDLKPYNSLTASHSEADETAAEAPDGIVDDEFDEEEPLFHPNPELLTVKEEPSPTSYGEEQQLNHEPSASSSTSRMETTPVRKESQASTMETRSARKRPREEDPTQRALRIAEMLLEQREKDETEVSLYIRSIAKTLEQMDPRAFALARVRISQILYDCQFESNGV